MTAAPLELLRLPCGHVATRARVKAALREGPGDGWSAPLACGFDGCRCSYVLSKSRDGWEAVAVTPGVSR